MKLFRVYVDTSVFGGCLDPEFALASRRFFNLVKGERVIALISDVVVRELVRAPQAVRNLLESLPPHTVDRVELTPEVLDLRDAYIAAGIVSRRFTDDATHVAAATVVRADAIVSWNFKHIVRLDKMKAYNRINLEMGFETLSIVSPQEIHFDEDE